MDKDAIYEFIDAVQDCLDKLKEKDLEKDPFFEKNAGFFFRQLFFALNPLLRDDREAAKKLRDSISKMGVAPFGPRAEDQNREAKAAETPQQSTKKAVYETPQCGHLGELVRKSGCSCKNHSYKCDFKNAVVRLKECASCPENPANRTQPEALDTTKKD